MLTSSGNAPNLNNLVVSVVLHSVTLNPRSSSYAITGNSISLQNGGFITDASNTGVPDLINTGVSLNGAATFTLSAGAIGLTFGNTITGAITGTGPLTLVNNSGNDALRLNVANSYTGATIINGTGRVLASVNDAIPTGSALTVNGNLLFNLVFGASSTIGSLAGGGTVALGSTPLTTGGDNTSTTFSGLSGSFGLTKTGSGTMTLSGANTYSGGTTGSIVGNVTNNAALVFNRSDSITFGGGVSGTGTLPQSLASNYL